MCSRKDANYYFKEETIMTDINHLPKGADLPENRMTREEWKHYFECREKYDVKYSEMKIQDLFHQMDDAYEQGDFEAFDKIAGMIRYLPKVAVGIKRTKGLKALQFASLSDAK